MKVSLSTWNAMLVSALALAGSSAHAAKFTNQFVEFELPPKWQCSLEGAEWVCQSTDEDKKKDAIIVLAAKLKGDQDSLDQYLDYLKKPKSYTSVTGKPVKSDPKYAKSLEINTQPWVDSLHLESEIPGFYTRYLATVKSDIGVLVTYSINKNKYQQYLNDFETMVKTLKVFRKAGGINASPSGGNIFANTKIPSHMQQQSVFGNIPTGDDVAQKPLKPQGDDTTFFLLIGAGAVLGFLIWKKKRG